MSQGCPSSTALLFRFYLLASSVFCVLVVESEQGQDVELEGDEDETQGSKDDQDGAVDVEVDIVDHIVDLLWLNF